MAAADAGFRGKSMKLFRKLWSGLTSAIIGIVVVMALLLAVPQLMGLKLYTVLSGSMEPQYHTGSVIYVKDVEPETLQVRDVITFYLTGNTVATHRIVDLVPDENDSSVVRFRTKGDANNVEDASLVGCDQVIGTPVFSVPLLGYIVVFIQQPPGRYIAVAAGCAMALLLLLPELITTLRQPEPAPQTEDKPADESETL